MRGVKIGAVARVVKGQNGLEGHNKEHNFISTFTTFLTPAQALAPCKAGSTTRVDLGSVSPWWQ